MPRVGFGPEIPTTKLPQTYVLGRAATGSVILTLKYSLIVTDLLN
jgi:hypothetical protein